MSGCWVETYSIYWASKLKVILWMNGRIDGYDLFWWSFSANPAVCQTLVTCVIGWLDGCARKRLIVLPAGGCKHAKELIRWLHADGAQTFPRPSSPQHIRCTSIYPGKNTQSPNGNTSLQYVNKRYHSCLRRCWRRFEKRIRVFL